ncbi:MAG TPA: AAA family ATPase, partial [Acidimicrobiales bacterium]|nr:AAA family ATPase [Acidimicrobiales bacterium]
MPRRISSPRFIGRDAELGRLEALLAFEGQQPPIVLVEGEAGVGKSRLVAEFASRTTDHGVQVLSGGCSVLGGGHVPYAPMVQALRSFTTQHGAAEAAAALGPASAALAALVPELTPADATEVGAADQGALFELVLAALGSLAEAAPVI